MVYNNNVNKNNPICSINKQELVALFYFKVKNNQEENISVNEAIKNIVASYQSFCLNKRDDIELFTL